MNLIRLCELAEAYLGAGFPDKATETLATAKKIAAGIDSARISKKNA